MFSNQPNPEPGEYQAPPQSVDLPTSQVPGPAALDMGGILADVLSAEDAGLSGRPSFLDRFLGEDDDLEALAIWCRSRVTATDVKQALAAIQRDIGTLDRALNRQVNVILHHKQFQELEASWRGLELLVDQAAEDFKQILRVRVLHAKWEELGRDASRAVEPDRTVLFRKVYEEEFGMPNGEPFGVLVGNYQVRNQYSDILTLQSISHVAAAAFAPFVASADPTLLGGDDIGVLERRAKVARLHQSEEFLRWNSLRRHPDSRFIGLTLPRILLRRPYVEDSAAIDRHWCPCGAEIQLVGEPFCGACERRFDPDDPESYRSDRVGFPFREEVTSSAENYLWGNACFAFASVLIRAFLDQRWFANIRGFGWQRNSETGGIVATLPSDDFGLDGPGVAAKQSVEVVIDEEYERELAAQGFIPICRCYDTPYSAFFSNNSIYAGGDDVDARIQGMLQYVLCVSRFAHYLKQYGRSKIGSLSEAREVEEELNRWIVNYKTADPTASDDRKAQFPLRDASVSVNEVEGHPGVYTCKMTLVPHYQLDELQARIELTTEIRA